MKIVMACDKAGHCKFIGQRAPALRSAHLGIAAIAAFARIPGTSKLRGNASQLHDCRRFWWLEANIAVWGFS